MEIKLRNAIVVAMEEAKESASNISSYSLNCNASGIWQLILFWRGKNEGKKKPRMSYILDANINNMILAARIVDQLIKDAACITLEDKLKKEEEEPTKQGKFHTFG